MTLFSLNLIPGTLAGFSDSYLSYAWALGSLGLSVLTLVALSGVVQFFSQD